MKTQYYIKRKALQKAYNNGFRHTLLFPEIVNEDEMVKDSLGRLHSPFLDWLGSDEEWLFDHDFAKAFWPGMMVSVDGEVWTDLKIGDSIESALKEAEKNGVKRIMPAFLYHLAQLAITKDRYEYLEPFL